MVSCKQSESYKYPEEGWCVRALEENVEEPDNEPGENDGHNC
jgi:hypothetical protein